MVAEDTALELSHANILAVQSYGFIESRLDLDSGANGSRGRLLWAATLVEAGRIKKENLIALFPQGMTLARQFFSADPSDHLCFQMARYLGTRPEMKGIQIEFNTLGRGTIEDVQNTVKMVRKMGYKTAHISFVSDPVHIKRVRMIWERVRPLGWTADFYGSPFHQMTWRERWIREPAARFQCLWKLGFSPKWNENK